MKGLTTVVLITLFILVYSMTYASELVYSPVNPSFGGNPYNGSWMLSQAQLQDDNKEPESITDRDPLEEFQESMVRRIMSQISTRIVGSAFGDYGDDLQSGTYEFGDYTFDIIAVEGENVTVTITDIISGGITTIEVPYYQ